MEKPICLVDLDDTLFQTLVKTGDEHRKINLEVAALDKNNQPRSYMTAEQNEFYLWLMKNTVLIPVTARSSAEMSLVTLSFNSWKITTHGGVIFNPEGQVDEKWKRIIKNDIQQYHMAMLELHDQVLNRLQGKNSEEVKLHFQCSTPVYLSVKIPEVLSDVEVREIIFALSDLLSLPDFTVHQNANNIHWIPKCVNKGRAVKYLMEVLKKQRGKLITIALADSTSDYDFMQLCSWRGFPQLSQLDKLLSQAIKKQEGIA